MSPAPHRIRSAFTLVELLVVVGIIALLIALLLPVLSNARRSANLTICATNLRAIGQAAYTYANDFNNLVARDDYDAKEYFWAILYAKKLTNRSISATDAKDKDKVIEFLSREKVYHCPALPEDTTHALHYTANNSRIEQGEWGYPPKGVADDFIKLNQLPPGVNPARIAYIVETNYGQMSNDVLSYFDLQSEAHLMFDTDGNARGARMIKASDTRHGGRTPVLFFDSHVEIRDQTPEALPASLFNPDAAAKKK